MPTDTHRTEERISRWERYAHIAVWAAPLFGLAVLLALLLFYVGVFGPDLSHRQNVWADFGNYLGGVVSPILNLLTIVLLVFTLQVQREELRLSREELRRSTEALETQARQFASKNVKDDLLNRADAVFNDVKKLRGEQLNAYYAFRTAADLVDCARQGINADGEMVFTGRSWDDLMKDPSPPFATVLFGDDERALSMKKALRPLIAALKELADYLDAIDALSDGDRRATNFYRRRLQTTVASLHELRYLPDGLMGRFDDALPTMPVELS